MSACILFILFNGAAYVTPGCYINGGFSEMLPPQDVVYLQHLPPELSNVVYVSPHYYHNYYRPQRRLVRNWRGYRYGHNHYRRNTIRRHRNIRPYYRHRTQREPRLRRRTVRRHYDRQGNLRRRVVTRRYQ
jgi:hypothetical protein